MILLGTLHKRNFDQGNKWYFVPELLCDIGIGVMIPNDNYIKNSGIPIDSNEEYTENQVVEVEWIPELKFIKIKRYVN